MQIEITVKGAGTTFGLEMVMVRNLFQACGYDVTVIDEYPLEGDPTAERARQLENQKMLEQLYGRKIAPTKVLIRAHHENWGG